MVTTQVYRAVAQDSVPDFKQHWNAKMGADAAFLAVSMGSEAVVKWLVSECPEDVRSMRDKRNRTLLHEAAAFGRSNIHSCIVKSGIDLNAVDTLHRTPLHEASARGRTEAVKALLEAGAQCDCADDVGGMPLDAATNEECKMLLREAMSPQQKEDSVENTNAVGSNESNNEAKEAPMQTSRDGSGALGHPIPSGTKVLVKYGGRDREYVGVIQQVYEKEDKVVYDVVYPDDDFDSKIPSAWVRRWVKFQRPLPSQAASEPSAMDPSSPKRRSPTLEEPQNHKQPKDEPHQNEPETTEGNEGHPAAEVEQQLPEL